MESLIGGEVTSIILFGIGLIIAGFAHVAITGGVVFTVLILAHILGYGGWFFTDDFDWNFFD